ncbi:MFS transporter [Steroidobacter sp.]|uniref:MFS transporter n=1 Tax=Steroidobacter sp. TaxID=1978227 RepID=UPI001A5F9C3C|nr:MFS transporter [Steroidobacter sp.]MBL8270322.1 MFS transporter [Steroidobacter sp.]
MTSLSAQTRAVLRHPNLLFFISARFLATLAAQIQVVAVGWQMYDITGDPLDLGLIGLSQFIPFVTLILPAGHAADHHNRSRIVTSCYFTNAVCALALLLITLGGMQSVWPVFIAMMLLGAARAFSMPAAQSVLPNLVPVDSFKRAVALNSSSLQFANIIGPAVGGVLYLAGPSVVYASVMVLALAAALLMFQIRGATEQSNLTREPLSMENLLSGLKFVRSRPIVFGAISLDLFAVLFGGATALLPMFASDILHAGPAGLGLLRTAPGIGAAACGLLLALSPISRHVGPWMFGGVAVFGVATIVFGLSTNFYLSMLALIVLGAADMVSVYVRHLLVQLDTPDFIRGRVSAVASVFIGASNEFGDFESGLMAKWWGAVRAVVIGGVATLVVTGLWARLFPVLWKMQTFPEKK